jgi:hypothetical protein
MSSGRGDEGGIPRGRRRVLLPQAGASAHEDWGGANEAKADKLRRNDLQRRARARGLELRHSAYGYALIDAARQHVEDRSDMTLDDVESWLARS